MKYGLRAFLAVLCLGLACTSPNTADEDGGDGGDDGGDSGVDGGADAGGPTCLSANPIMPVMGAVGDTFTITGTCFEPDVVVNFGIVPIDPTTTSVNSDGTVITGLVPANEGGSSTVSIGVTNPENLMDGVPAGTFTYGSDILGFCKVMAPTSVEVLANTATPLLYAEVTPASVALAANGPLSYVGYGTATMGGFDDPWEYWNWNLAGAADAGSGNVQLTDAGAAIYEGSITPTAPGQYQFGFRFTQDGLNFVYCTTTGDTLSLSPDGGPNLFGTLIVDATPTISGLSPTSGAAGAMVTVTGTGLNAQNISVTFGGEAATIDTVDPEGMSLTVTAPSGTGMVAVAVSVDGTSFAAGEFSYN